MKLTTLTILSVQFSSIMYVIVKISRSCKIEILYTLNNNSQLSSSLISQSLATSIRLCVCMNLNTLNTLGQWNHVL